MTPIPVTLVTENASQDPVTDALYLSILHDLRAQGMTYRDLADALGGSPAAWRFRDIGERSFTDEARQALRTFTDEFPPLPLTVGQVAEQMVDPDAAVYLVGGLPDGERVRRVLLLAKDGQVSVSANGTVSAAYASAETGDGGKGSVTHVISGAGAKRDTRYRPTVSACNRAWLKAQGLTVNGAIEGLRIRLDRDNEEGTT